MKQKQWLWSYLTAYKTKRFIDVLPKLVRNYNTSPHSALGGSTPSKPDPDLIAKRIARKEYLANLEQQTFQVGDEVRSLKNKIMFEKGAAPKWSETVHKVVRETTAKRYELDNGKTYLYYQLKPVIVDEFTPPEPAGGDIIEPKKERLALKKEGVEKANIRQGLRERKPATALLTKHGERVNW